MANKERFVTHKPVGPRGFTKWVQPHMAKYLLQCCDCGLVHELQFRVAGVKVKKVQFRARRADGHTARERKKRGITVTHGE